MAAIHQCNVQKSNVEICQCKSVHLQTLAFPSTRRRPAALVNMHWESRHIVMLLFFFFFGCDNSLEIAYDVNSFEPHIMSLRVWLVDARATKSKSKSKCKCKWIGKVQGATHSIPHTHQIKRANVFGYLVFGFETAFAYII